MSLAEKILPHYTYEDYVQWEGRWELIEGFPIAMSPAPIPKHQWVVANILYEFVKAIKESKGKKCKAYAHLDFKIAEDTVIQPDALIACGEIKKKFLDFPPVLVVEVLSPATALRDRHTKFKMYEQEGVKYFLLVNVESETVEIYLHSADGYQAVKYDADTAFDFELEEGCTISILLKEIWD